ncbi:MAG: tRNA pseudouridine(38-40) synthase TruA [Waddliaceae bacterium]
MARPMTSPSWKYKICFAYDGTQYCGWQIQSNALTIQEVLEKKLSVILRRKTTVTGASRTDSGVHAQGQVAHFEHPEEIECFRFLASINGVLPRDIRVKTIEAVDKDFHARFHAANKIYHYHLNLGYIQDPFTRRYSWHIPQKLDLDLLKKGAALFVGTHDFTSFSNEALAGAAAKNPVRTLRRLEMVFEDNGVRLEYEAKGFLYKMVRNITGTLIEAAMGQRAVHEIPEIFSAKDRRKGGRTAPPQGLFLVKVEYA